MRQSEYSARALGWRERGLNGDFLPYLKSLVMHAGLARTCFAQSSIDAGLATANLFASADPPESHLSGQCIPELP